MAPKNEVEKKYDDDRAALEAKRGEIDALDNQVLGLFNQLFDLAEKRIALASEGTKIAAQCRTFERTQEGKPGPRPEAVKPVGHSVVGLGYEADPMGYVKTFWVRYSERRQRGYKLELKHLAATKWLLRAEDPDGEPVLSGERQRLAEIEGSKKVAHASEPGALV